MGIYCVMNIKKNGRGAVTGLQMEANRQQDDGRKFAGSDIDETRTGDNIFLRQEENWSARITKEIKDAGVRERKDSVVLLTGVYTASPEWFKTHSQTDALTYFCQCLDYHERTYGHAFSAIVHMDEKTPHMHVASVPIVHDEKGAHLSAKLILGDRAKMRQRQTNFHKEVGRAFGMERGKERDPAEIRKHIEKRDWQIAEQERQLAQTRKELEKAQRNLTNQIEKSRKLLDINTEHENAKQTLDRERVKVNKMAYEEQQSLLKDLKTYIDTLHENTTITAAVLADAKRLQQEAEKLRDEREAKVFDAVNAIADQRKRELEGEYKERQKAVEGLQRQYKELIDNQDELIAEKAYKLAERALLNTETSPDKTKRLEQFCRSRGILQDFEKQERQLLHAVKSHTRGR